MKKTIGILIIAFVGFWAIFYGLQNDTIYYKTLGLVSQNWENIDGERQLVHKPFNKFDNTNSIHWDASHYQMIKDTGYRINETVKDRNFAFFPLFPFIWKASHLPPVGVPFLNYLLFSCSVLLLLKLFSNKQDYKKHVLIALSLPSIIIFFIPYSEATFLLMVTIGVYGFLKKKYWIYFVGLFLAALARPAYTFLFLSIIGTEVFFFLTHKKGVTFVKNCFLRTLPLLVGTCIVSVIQFMYGSGSIFKFVEVQKYWDNKFAIPHNLRDWSHEGFGINVGIVIILFIPLFWVFVTMLAKRAKEYFNPSFEITENVPEDRKYYVIILSLLYFIGSVLFILFFREGSLHCLFRFTLCTPFAYILLFGAFERIQFIFVESKFFILAILATISIFIWGLADYSTFWSFSDFGIFLLIACLFLWLFQEKSNSKYYKISQYTILIFNIIWTTYLFNMYLSDGWIYA